MKRGTSTSTLNDPDGMGVLFIDLMAGGSQYYQEYRIPAEYTALFRYIRQPFSEYAPNIRRCGIFFCVDKEMDLDMSKVIFAVALAHVLIWSGLIIVIPALKR